MALQLINVNYNKRFMFIITPPRSLFSHNNEWLNILDLSQYTGVYDEDDDDDYEPESIIEANNNTIDAREKIAIEIQQLRDREHELRFEHNNFIPSDDESGENQHDTDKEYMDPRERIEQEIRLQQEREVEINQIHRSLSNENLLTINDYNYNDDAFDQRVEDVDTRVKIYKEMEDLKRREKELRGNLWPVLRKSQRHN